MFLIKIANKGTSLSKMAFGRIFVKTDPKNSEAHAKKGMSFGNNRKIEIYFASNMVYIIKLKVKVSAVSAS